MYAESYKIRLVTRFLPAEKKTEADLESIDNLRHPL